MHKILEIYQHFMLPWRTPHPLGSSCDDSWQSECCPRAMHSIGRPFYHWKACARLRRQIRLRSWFIFPRLQKVNSKVNTEIRTLVLSMHCTGNGTLGITEIRIKFTLKEKKAMHSVNVQSFTEHSLLILADFYTVKMINTSVQFSHKTIKIQQQYAKFISI